LKTIEIKTLDKYSNSTLYGIPIKELRVHADGQVKIATNGGTVAGFYIDEDNTEQTADYIICLLQHENGVNVKK